MGQFLWSGVSARPWNVAVDRFAREIVRFRIMEMSVPGGGKVGFGFCGTDRASKS
jgi:hypothetical protein